MSLCGLIVLLAFTEHSDMPRKVMGIQGLNPLNVLLLFVVAGWLIQRHGEKLRWDMPRYLNWLLLGYLVVFMVATGRLLLNLQSVSDYYTATRAICEGLINTIKWVIPGLLIYHGCRTVKRVKMSLVAICLFHVFVGLQVVINTPISGLWDADLFEMRMRLGGEIGLTPALLGKVFAGGAWAVLAAGTLTRQKKYRIAAFGAFVMLSLALGLVGSRSAYFAWMVVGGLMCLLRWRKQLILAPIGAVILFAVLPTVTQRMSSGFGQTNLSGRQVSNMHLITSGRNLIWPYVIDKISQAPVFGHGRDAMRSTGLTKMLSRNVGEGEAVGHAHNAYLNLTLEAGVAGLAVVMLFYATVVFLAAGLFRRQDPLYVAVGGVALAILTGHLAACIGSQNFWPQEGDIGIWCAIGLLLRMVKVECEVLDLRRMHQQAMRTWNWQPTLGPVVSNG